MEDLSLTQMDFSSLEEVDPSVADGSHVVYDRECPFELRVQHSSHDTTGSSLEAIKVKVLVLGDDHHPHGVRIELSSENDLFFHYFHNVDEVSFRVMQEQQKLMVDFPEYVNVLVKMLNSCIKEPHSHLAVLLVHTDGTARLDFIKNMEYKFVELLNCSFEKSSEDTVKDHITFRYNAMKTRLALLQGRMADISSLVKSKNPSLLLQLQNSAKKKTPSKSHFSGY